LLVPAEAKPAQLVRSSASGADGAEQTSDKARWLRLVKPGRPGPAVHYPGRWFGYSGSVMRQSVEAATSHLRRVNDVILTFLVWVLVGASLAFAGVIVAYIERRD
jgi:hypothetical protein